MDLSLLQTKLRNGEVVYLKDDFEEVVVRLVPYEAGPTKAFLKHKGLREVEVPQSYETLVDATLCGEEITNEEYEAY